MSDFEAIVTAMNNPSRSANNDLAPLGVSDEESDLLRRNINELRVTLGRFFVAKQELIDLLMIAALAGEPLLLVGPAGTGKSDVIAKFTDALGVDGSDFFEYTLTSGTQPHEILGDPDPDAVADRWPNLCTARIAIVNEVFRANSPVLNALLRFLDSRTFDGMDATVPRQRRLLFAASGDIPEEAGLSGLVDRFALKVESLPVHHDQFGDLINIGLRNDVHEPLDQKPWAAGKCTFEDVVRIQDIVARSLVPPNIASTETGGASFAGPGMSFAADLLGQYQRLVKALAREDRIRISDRRLIKLYRLMCIRAWMFGRVQVAVDDLSLLAYSGNTREEIALLREKVPVLLAKL